MDKPALQDVMRALDDVDYPASKDDLIAAAERSGAGGAVLHALRAIPLADYASRDDIVKSVPLASDPG